MSKAKQSFINKCHSVFEEYNGYRREWKEQLDEYFAQYFDQGLSVEEAVTRTEYAML